ncbi:MAG: glycosyltransferase family 4 protein [Ilumatobacter sp.]|uniref:glycosyltransferase family 4 protein n=1 Tax=Ilumatobacter sp. TaxID=1967498 RepID=UPI0032981612
MTAHSNEQALRVLVVLTSDARRGAEIEGERLARELAGGDMVADAVALARAESSAPLDVETLGRSTLALGTLRALRRRVRDVDVVIAFGSRALPACAIATLGSRTPFIYRSIGDPSAWAHTGWRRRRTGWLMRRAAVVVALWPGGEQAIRTLYGAERTVSIPNARSAEEFHPPEPQQREAARERLDVKASDRVILWVGSITPEKRLGLAIDAVALLSDEHLLLVVGDGPLRDELEEEAARALGGRCRFLGTLADVRETYWAADVVLSTSSTEGMPGVLIEAGLCGVPVVATSVGAVTWMFDRGQMGTTCGVDESARRIGSAIVETIEADADEVPSTSDVPALWGWVSAVAAWEEVVLQARSRW